METRITRPTLDELWRVLLATLEGRGAVAAPSLARSLAIAGLTGRPAEAMGVRVERRGEEVLVIGHDLAMTSIRPAGLHGETGPAPPRSLGQAHTSD